MLGLFFALFLMLQGEPNANECIDASRSFLITCLTIDLIVVIICLVLNRQMNRRLMGYVISLVVPLIIGFVVSSALVAWNPLKTEVFMNCLEVPSMARYVAMGTLAEIPKGIVLGGVVTVVLYLLLVFILGFIAKRK